jgi:hypothetical protein
MIFFSLNRAPLIPVDKLEANTEYLRPSLTWKSLPPRVSKFSFFTWLLPNWRAEYGPLMCSGPRVSLLHLGARRPKSNYFLCMSDRQKLRGTWLSGSTAIWMCRWCLRISEKKFYSKIFFSKTLWCSEKNLDFSIFLNSNIVFGSQI